MCGGRSHEVNLTSKCSYFWVRIFEQIACASKETKLDTRIVDNK